MPSTTGEPPLVRLSVRLYRALLAAYPAGFREEYGSLMVQVFHDCCLSAARGAPGGLSGLWLRTLADYFITLIEQHARGGAAMTHSRWIKTAGWLLAGAGLLMLFSWLASTRPVYNQYNAAAWPVDRFLNQATRPAMIAGAIFALLGLAGLHSRYAPTAGRLGRAGLVISMVGDTVSLIGMVGQAINDNSPWWQLLMLGITALFAGLALFGAASLRLKLLPRWNALPLLISLPWLVAILIELLAALARVPYVISSNITGPIIIISFLGLALLGYRLQADPAAPGRPALS